MTWTNGQRIQELAGFYVFDGNSLVAHLTGANPISFSPLGLSLLTKLAEVTDQVRSRVRRLIAEKETAHNFHMLFQGNSEVANLVNHLGVHTDLEALEQLGKLSVDEEQEAVRLDKEIAELKLLNIPREIEKNRREIRDLETLIDFLKKAQTSLNDTALAQVNRLIEQVQERGAEVEHSGTDQFTFSPFTRVGSIEWGNFLRAAKTLADAEKSEYPEPDDHCLLCRQKLPNDAVELIRRLWDFLKSDAPAQLATARNACNSKVVELENVALDYFGPDSGARRLVQDQLPLMIDAIEAQVGACDERRQSMVEALRSSQACNPPPAIEIDLGDVPRLIEARRRGIEELQRSDVGQRLLRAEHALRQLKHRVILGEHMTALRSYVDGTRWAARSRQTLGSTKTITNKYNELFTELVTERYTNEFETTLRRFKDDMRVTIQTRGMKGETVREITLRYDAFPAGYHVDRILSDGEKRAVAIADFLTEVSLDRSCTGIILDDPVTSFDDTWKNSLAQCLAEHASSRQVIIFTHDLSFLYRIKSHAKQLSINIVTHWIKEENGHPGFVYLNDSPVCEEDYKSADIARRCYSDAKDLAPSEQQFKLQQGFGALRTSYEALVIFGMFNDVVARFKERISFDRLKDVWIDPKLVEEVITRMEALSRHIDAHLHSDAFATGKPTPKDLLTEIEAFEAIRKRQVELKKNAQS